MTSIQAAARIAAHIEVVDGRIEPVPPLDVGDVASLLQAVDQIGIEEAASAPRIDEAAAAAFDSGHHDGVDEGRAEQFEIWEESANAANALLDKCLAALDAVLEDRRRRHRILDPATVGHHIEETHKLLMELRHDDTHKPLEAWS